MVSLDSRIATWTAQATQGDGHAVQRLFLLYHARLRARARRGLPAVLRRKLDPDDLLQQAYVEALRRFDEFEDRGGESFFAWLCTILDSRLIDARRFYATVRRDVRREAVGAEAPSDYPLLAARVAMDSVTPSRVAARTERDALLMASLAGLPEDQRRVVELRFLRGHRLEEIATMMQRSPAAVQMLCGRALRKLRDSIRSLSRLGA